jgi:hypothetical protein
MPDDRQEAAFSSADLCVAVNIELNWRCVLPDHVGQEAGIHAFSSTSHTIKKIQLSFSEILAELCHGSY